MKLILHYNTYTPSKSSDTPCFKHA